MRQGNPLPGCGLIIGGVKKCQKSENAPGAERTCGIDSTAFGRGNTRTVMAASVRGCAMTATANSRPAEGRP
jgi:hypothetical protein